MGIAVKKTVMLDHCTGEAYQKVGNAFILNVLPNLSRPLPPLEVATVPINMVPSGLRDHKLRLKEQLEDGLHSLNDLRYALLSSQPNGG